MHYINHNFTDWDFETKHMSRIEKMIYLDLRSLYLSTEKAIDASDMPLLERRMSIANEDEKQALAFVLKDKFSKSGKSYKSPVWDKIIKDYKYQEVVTAVGDMVKRLKASGNIIESNAGTPAIRALYINRFGYDKLTRITNANETANAKANNESETTNANTNETANALTNAERQAKSKAERKHMVDSLKSVGEKVTLKTGISMLRELYSKHFNSDAALDIANANSTNSTNGTNETANAKANTTNESETKNANESNGRKDAITINHKPLTNNHKPIERETPTQAVTAADNSLEDITAADLPTVTQPPQQTEAVATQPVTKADEVRNQNADDIENWQAPTFKQMQDQLLAAGKKMSFTGTQYTMHIEDFKAHYAEQALLGKPIKTDANRKAKLRKWLMGEVDRHTANEARQAKAKGTFNIDNEDWSGSTANQPTRHDSDIPNVYHPSHSTTPTGTDEPLFLNGLKRQPFAGMTTDESYALVDRHTQPGESRVAAYDRLLADTQEAV